MAPQPPPAPTEGPVLTLTPADVAAAVKRWRRLASPEFRDLLDAR